MPQVVSCHSQLVSLKLPLYNAPQFTPSANRLCVMSRLGSTTASEPFCLAALEQRYGKIKARPNPFSRQQTSIYPLKAICYRHKNRLIANLTLIQPTLESVDFNITDNQHSLLSCLRISKIHLRSREKTVWQDGSNMSLLLVL